MIFRVAGLCAAIATVLLIAAAGAESPLAQEGGADSAEAPTATTETQVMTGLYNPRGLAFGPDGALYVAESGYGDPKLALSCDRDVDNDGLVDDPDPFPCGGHTFLGPVGGTVSYGPTGAISRLLLEGGETQEQIVTGLPSVATVRFSNGGAGVNGNGARTLATNLTAQAGPTDISFLDTGSPSRHGAYVTIGLQANPAIRTSVCDGVPTEAKEYCANVLGNLGKLGYIPANTNYKWEYVADVAAYEAKHNPDGELDANGNPVYDSNPYGVLADPGGSIIADAGGNSLLLRNPHGKISLLATFPRVTRLAPLTGTTDAVPTSVVVGPDGAYYVGQLTGVPFQEGTANVYRVVPGEEPVDLGEADVYLDGFKSIVDIAFDTEGRLYVLQIASGATGNVAGTGKLIRVDNPGDPSETRTTIREGLDSPTSVVVDRNDNRKLYVTNHATNAVNSDDGTGSGEVLSFELSE